MLAVGLSRKEKVTGTSDLPGVRALDVGRVRRPLEMRGCGVETDPARMAAILLGLNGARVLGAGEDDEGLVAEVEIELLPDAVRCPACGSFVALDGTEKVEQHGPVVFGRPALLIWRLRRFRCEDVSCATNTFVEELPPLNKA